MSNGHDPENMQVRASDTDHGPMHPPWSTPQHRTATDTEHVSPVQSNGHGNGHRPATVHRTSPPLSIGGADDRHWPPSTWWSCTACHYEIRLLVAARGVACPECGAALSPFGTADVPLDQLDFSFQEYS